MWTFIKKFGGWFEKRLKLKSSVVPMLDHPIPRGAAGPMGWFYVFGSASMTLFMLQVLTGVCLGILYVPSGADAYQNLEYINYTIPFGWFLRAVHNWGASAMVVMVLVHATQVYLFAAYKYPRELTWVFGVFLLLLTLAMAFTGQVLRWDEDAYWGVNVGGAMAGRLPIIGPAVVELVIGGPIVGGNTLSRFFALHVFVVPGLLAACLAVHLYLVLTVGISKPPKPGEKVDPATFGDMYKKELKRGVPFLGEAMWKDAFASGVVVILVISLAACLGPKGPAGYPDPSTTGANPRPDWPFLWIFAILALSPPNIETAIMFALPAVLILVLLLVPFISNRGERAARRRPVAVLSVILIYLIFGVLTFLGAIAPWSPKMEAWSEDSIPIDIVKKSTPLELKGAALFQNKDCRNCHSLNHVGGLRGPDLTYVGTRLTRNEFIDQIANGTPGGGNMPQFGKQVSPSQMDALVAFLISQRPKGWIPRRGSVVYPPEQVEP